MSKRRVFSSMLFRVQSSQHRRALLLLSLIWTAILVLWTMDNNEVDNTNQIPSTFVSRMTLAKINSWHSDKRPPLSSRFTTYRQSELHYWTQSTQQSEENPHQGQNGSAFILEDPKEIKEDARSRHIHQLSLVVSDKLSLNRSLPDLRPKSCQLLSYPSGLPDVSVIIVFHNEPLSTLLRTVHSIVNRSPHQLLKEIILVDDASTQEDLLVKLPSSLSSMGVRTSIVRTGDRVGLIEARLRGAEVSSASVLIFLDSHIEVTPHWLPPLLAVISEQRSIVALPIVDDIDAFSFEYSGPESLESGRVRGGLDWKLMHSWLAPDNESNIENHYDEEDVYYSKNFVTPTMIGCAMAVDRDFFFAIGAFDQAMRIWGGENVEMSVRVWRCGGALVKVPCSHVGHVYRSSTPHSIPGDLRRQKDTSLINTARFAEVWTDEYKKFFYFINPHARTVDLGDLRGRVELRDELKCHSFEWFLDNVYPDHPFPKGNNFFGQIMEKQSQLCLDAMGVRGPPTIRQCHGLGGFQNIIYDEKRGQLRSSTRCLQPVGERLSFETCDDSAAQKWLWKDSSGAGESSLVHKPSNLCLTSGQLKVRMSKAEEKAQLLSFLANVVLDADKSSSKSTITPTLQPCNNTFQTWIKASRAQWRDSASN